MTRLGDLLDFGQILKTLATIILSKSPTFLCNLCSKGVKIFDCSSEIIFWATLIDIWRHFTGHTAKGLHMSVPSTAHCTSHMLIVTNVYQWYHTC